MNIIKKIKIKLFYLLNMNLSSDEFNYVLKKQDIKIGEKTRFFGASKITVDIQRPWLIEIGAYTRITQGTIILQHDYSRSVLQRKYNDILCEAGKTTIGDNCFIGMNSIILMGSHIGNNVIVGAGSVVSGDIPDNSVVCGNPARIIRTIDEHYKIRKSKQIEEAKLCAKEFYNYYHRKPSIHDLGTFFPLYMKRDLEEFKVNNLSTNFDGDNEKILENFLSSVPEYDSFDDFLNDALK